MKLYSLLAILFIFAISCGQDKKSSDNASETKSVSYDNSSSNYSNANQGQREPGYSYPDKVQYADWQCIRRPEGSVPIVALTGCDGEYAEDGNFYCYCDSVPSSEICDSAYEGC